MSGAAPAFSWKTPWKPLNDLAAKLESEKEPWRWQEDTYDGPGKKCIRSPTKGSRLPPDRFRAAAPEIQAAAEAYGVALTGKLVYHPPQEVVDLTLPALVPVEAECKDRIDLTGLTRAELDGYLGQFEGGEVSFTLTLDKNKLVEKKLAEELVEKKLVEEKRKPVDRELVEEKLKQLAKEINWQLYRSVELFAGELKGGVEALKKLEAWWHEQPPRKLVVLLPEWDGFLDGPYIAVVGGDPTGCWEDIARKPPPLEPRDEDLDDDVAVFELRDVYQAAEVYLKWHHQVELDHLTPYHLLPTAAAEPERAASGSLRTRLNGLWSRFKKAEDQNRGDVVADALRLHLANLCVLYTADATTRKDDEWIATFNGAQQHAELTLPAVASPPQAVDPRGVAKFAELVDWAYSRGFVGNRLSFIQNAVAVELYGGEPEEGLGRLLARMQTIQENLRSNWKMFINEKVDNFVDQEQALEDHVAATIQGFSQQTTGMIKSLSDTMLASVAVLVTTLIASLFKQGPDPAVLATGVLLYIIYLLVFPLGYNMVQRCQAYCELSRHFDRRWQRFAQRLPATRLKKIGGDSVKTSRRRFKWWFVFTVLAYLGAAAGLWRAVPSAIDAVAYKPADATLEGVLAPVDNQLRQARRIAEGKVHGGEDVAVDSQGRLYTGTADGRILRVTLKANGAEDVEIFAETGGRPLGLDFDEVSGELIVADAVKGLLAVDRLGKVVELTRQAGGVAFGLADDVDVSRDGRKIYFSDASTRFGLGRHLYDLLESRPHGRLLVHDRATGDTTVLLEFLYFANGVALSKNEDFVVVNETYRYRIKRCWLPGSPRAGECEVFADNLPGFPDGIASDGRGSFWLALYAPRNRLLDRWLHPSPVLKNQLAKLPRFLWPRPEPYGLVLQLDETGRVLRSLHDPGGRHVRGVTSVEPRGGELYLSSLDGHWIARWSQ